MFFNDPTLYGATLPQKEIPTPFYGHMVPPWQQLRMQQFPVQTAPWHNVPFQNLPLQQLPFQNIPFQNLPLRGINWQQPLYQNYVPAYPKQNYGFPAAFNTLPFTPYGMTPFVPNYYGSLPFYGWEHQAI